MIQHKLKNSDKKTITEEAVGYIKEHLEVMKEESKEKGYEYSREKNLNNLLDNLVSNVKDNESYGETEYFDDLVKAILGENYDEINELVDDDDIMTIVAEGGKYANPENQENITDQLGKFRSSGQTNIDDLMESPEETTDTTPETPEAKETEKEVSAGE